MPPIIPPLGIDQEKWKYNQHKSLYVNTYSHFINNSQNLGKNPSIRQLLNEWSNCTVRQWNIP